MRLATCELCHRPFWRRCVERFDDECREALLEARRLFGKRESPKADKTDEQLDMEALEWLESRGRAA